MEDREVIEAFVHRGAKTAFGPTLHIEGDAILLDGWWPTVYRIGPGAFILRAEDPPSPSDVPAQVVDLLRAAGLVNVGRDLPAITQITYTAQFSLGYVPWDMWAADLEAAEAALTARATEESFIEGGTGRGNGAGDFATEYGGARRVAGLPPAVVVTVGVDPEVTEALEHLLPDCHLVVKGMGEIRPDACGALIPSLMLVDGRSQQGLEFMMELRAVACGRTIPVVSVADEPGIPLGANATILTGDDPQSWVTPIRDLLP